MAEACTQAGSFVCRPGNVGRLGYEVTVTAERAIGDQQQTANGHGEDRSLDELGGAVNRDRPFDRDHVQVRIPDDHHKGRDQAG